MISIINISDDIILVSDDMLEINEIEKRLMKKEEAMDHINAVGRLIVRSCSNAIKAIHARDQKTATMHIKEAEKELKKFLQYEKDFPVQINHILQEYAEALIVLSAVSRKKIPSFEELGINEVAYLNGLLDAVGELKREMYEALRRGEKDEAKRYFALMEDIYDSLLPLRFSNSVLPDFRRKQDVARMQIEQARGELLR